MLHRLQQGYWGFRFARLLAIGVLLGWTLSACAESQMAAEPRQEMAGSEPSRVSQAPVQTAMVKTRGGITGDRTISGTVMEVTADQIKVNTGEVQPRFLPLGIAKEKGETIRKGDKLEILLNEQNLVVDFHPAGTESSHKVVKGQLATSLTIGQDHAVIRTEEGTEDGYEVRPLARSKVAAIPVGVTAVFLIDENNKIADATFGSKEAVEKAQAAWQKKSPIKGAHQRVEGTVMRTLTPNQITIRTEEGKEQPFGVRDIARGKVSKVDEGQRVILLIDNDNQVVDIAIAPLTKG
jgi:hypothetical protein